MVPTLVPMDMDMKQEARKRPQKMSFEGTRCRVAATVASMAPISFALPAKAPASTNIHIIKRILRSPAPFEKQFMRSRSLPGVVATAHIAAIRKADDTGTLPKSPTKREDSTYTSRNTSRGLSARRPLELRIIRLVDFGGDALGCKGSNLLPNQSASVARGDLPCIDDAYWVDAPGLEAVELFAFGVDEYHFAFGEVVGSADKAVAVLAERDRVGVFYAAAEEFGR